MTVPWRTATIGPSALLPARAMTSTPSPTDSTHGSADEDGVEGAALEALDVQILLVGVDLTSEGVATHDHVERRQSER